MFIENTLSMQIYKKMCGNLRSKTSLLILFSIVLTLSSCYKRKDTILKVYVRNSSGQVIEGAKVQIYAEPTDTSNHNAPSVNLNALTDETGTANFNFNFLYESGQTGVAILKAKATYYSQTGEEVVKIVEETNNETFVEIQ